VDKIEGVVDKHFFDKISKDWRLEQSRCLEQIVCHQNAIKPITRIECSGDKRQISSNAC
jgi:hypothetical protein